MLAVAQQRIAGEARQPGRIVIVEPRQVRNQARARQLLARPVGRAEGLRMRARVGLDLRLDRRQPRSNPAIWMLPGLMRGGAEIVQRAVTEVRRRDKRYMTKCRSGLQVVPRLP